MATSRSEGNAGEPSLRKDGGAEPADGRPFRRVLVANRGEIAVRVVRACRDLGIETVAVYSDADASAMHVRLADQAVRIGPPPPAESYLRIDAIVEAATSTGCDAVHPGYGFLSERAAFARAVSAAGLAFVGPSPDAIEALGDKLRARRLAREAGVPTVPGTLDPAPVDRPDQVEAIVAAAREIGYPLLVKAAAGGGGRGMRRVASERELPGALAAGAHEAIAAFGDGTVYLERELTAARHVEVQLLGDRSGRVVALGERDCSLQRRHQKLVEEAPAPGLTPEIRRELHDLAVRLGTAAGLENAATCEFLLGTDGSFAFLEVNTRLQVEHGVTELVTGLDLVVEQLRIAAGAPLSPDVLAAAERAAEPGRHAIEVRLSAEDPARQFAPAPGRITRWRMPAGPGVRVDTAIETGARVPPDYDNLIAKVMTDGPTREVALDRLRRALDEVEIAGIQTTLPFDRFVVRDAGFRAADVSTTWVDEHWDGAADRDRARQIALLAAGLAEREAPTGNAASPAAGGQAGRPAGPTGGWAQDALEAAVDRWPA